MQTLVRLRSRQLSWYHVGRAKAQTEKSDLQDGKRKTNLDNVTRAPGVSMPEAMALGVFVMRQ